MSRYDGVTVEQKRRAQKFASAGEVSDAPPSVDELFGVMNSRAACGAPWTASNYIIHWCILYICPHRVKSDFMEST